MTGSDAASGAAAPAWRSSSTPKIGLSSCQQPSCGSQASAAASATWSSTGAAPACVHHATSCEPLRAPASRPRHGVSPAATSTRAVGFARPHWQVELIHGEAAIHKRAVRTGSAGGGARGCLLQYTKCTHFTRMRNGTHMAIAVDRRTCSIFTMRCRRTWRRHSSAFRRSR